MATNDSGMPNQQNLSSYLDKSASVVHNYTHHFDKQYARPGIQTFQEFFDRRPIATVFLASFVAMSAVPVLSFIGMSLAVILAFTFVALSCAFVAAFAVIFGLLTLLISTLVATFFASVLSTIIAISFYISLRFFLQVRQDGTSGLANWAEETKGHMASYLPGRFLSGRPVPTRATSDNIFDAGHGVHLEEERLHTIPVKSSDDSSLSDSNIKQQGD